MSSVGETVEKQKQLKALKMKRRDLKFVDMKNVVFPAYSLFASNYEMVSKIVLIAVEICDGRFNSNIEYMSLRLGQIVRKFKSSEKYSIFGDLDVILRNSLAHGSKTLSQMPERTVRFFDKNNSEDLTYEQIMNKTLKLASLYYVTASYLVEGCRKELNLVNEYLRKSQNKDEKV